MSKIIIRRIVDIGFSFQAGPDFMNGLHSSGKGAVRRLETGSRRRRLPIFAPQTNKLRVELSVQNGTPRGGGSQGGGAGVAVNSLDPGQP